MPFSKPITSAIVRMQTYVEFLKANRIQNFRKNFNVYVADLQRKLLSVGYSPDNPIGNRKLNTLLKEVKALQRKHYAGFLTDFEQWLVAFMTEHVTMAEAVLQDGSGISLAQAEEENNNLIPIYALGLLTSDSFYKTIVNTVIPGYGVTLRELYNEWDKVAGDKLIKTIRAGMAQRLTLDQIIKNVMGNVENNYKGGIAATQLRDSNTLITTATQMVSQAVLVGAGSFYLSRYRYVAILDSSTTVICRSLNNRVFYFGKGPLPPMHLGCRSSVVPYVGNEPGPGTYREWLKEQPLSFKTDVTIYTNPESGKTLTLNQYRTKRSIITT